ncbi:hypothetical protein RSAG8_02178, partial [Rhizoctonia solani AG-8 WAC10335]
MARSVYPNENTIRPPALGASDDKRSTTPAFDLVDAPSPDHTLPAPAPRLSDPVQVARLFPPFKGCDLALRATKHRPHVQFYVDRETVYNHSSYLKRNNSGDLPIPAGIEVVSWEENADTLDAMLRLVYSDRLRPKVENVARLRFLLKTARKYGIEAARHSLGTAVLLELATREPIPAFVTACEFGLVDEAALISKETLKVDIMMGEESSELCRVSLSYYHRLLRLHKMRAAKAIEIISLIDEEHPMNEVDPPYCEGCGTNATWWQIFVQYGSIELKRRPVTDTIFSSAFLAKCVRTSRHICGQDIDALPAYLSSDDPLATK